MASSDADDKVLTAGWTRPGASKKWHYFQAGAKTSLCGKWMFVGERDDSDHDSPENCAECKRRRAKLYPNTQ